MRDRPTSVMLFAAGFGTRMRPLTDTLPKPMIPIAGRPLIDHALDLARDYGAARLVVNTHYLPGPLKRHLAGSDVQVSHEPEILDTGGGLRNALPLLGNDPLFTLNTDAVWRGPNPLAHLAVRWVPDQMDALLLCLPRGAALAHAGAGDFIGDEATPAIRGPGLVYSGLQILRTDGLGAISQHVFSLNRLWDGMLANRRLFVTAWPGKWCDVGRPESIPLAESMLRGDDV